MLQIGIVRQCLTLQNQELGLPGRKSPTWPVSWNAFSTPTQSQGTQASSRKSLDSPSSCRRIMLNSRNVSTPTLRLFWIALRRIWLMRMSAAAMRSTILSCDPRRWSCCSCCGAPEQIRLFALDALEVSDVVRLLRRICRQIRRASSCITRLSGLCPWSE